MVIEKSRIIWFYLEFSSLFIDDDFDFSRATSHEAFCFVIMDAFIQVQPRSSSLGDHLVGRLSLLVFNVAAWACW